MRIAHVITGLELGGAEMMLFKLLGAMSTTAFEPLVISLVPPGPMEERIAALGVRVETLGVRRGLPDPGAVLRLARLLREFRPDLVQTWMYHADLLGALAVPLAGRPTLVWNVRQSDLDPRLTRRATRVVARLGALLSHLAPDHIVCCSERARTVHRTLGYRDRILSVIPNGFDLDRFRPDPRARTELRAQLGVSATTPLIGLVARFDPQKDLRTFLDAAALVRAARSDCRFLLCGPDMDASNAQLTGWIGAVGLVDAVHLFGPRRDTPRVLAALDLLVSSSAYGEGFPNVIGEAMACGVPCAVTDVGDSVVIVADTGLGVPPREPDSLAAAIGRLLDEGPAGLAQRGRAARERIAAHYDLPRIAARYAELYLSLQRGKT